MLLGKANAVLPLQGAGGREPSRPQSRAQQVAAKDLALDHPPSRARSPTEAWQAVTWREDGEMFTSRFTRLRIRPVTRTKQPPEEWWLIEWPEDEPEPTKYWLSTLPVEIGFEALVDGAKLRWRIERDYQDLKAGSGAWPL
jgi:SRSO17 transposase